MLKNKITLFLKEVVKKTNNTIKEVMKLNNIKFSSQKEVNRYRELMLLQRVHKISDLKLQVRFILAPAQHGEKAVEYVADFTYMEGNKLVVEDIKGYLTKECIIKRKWFKDKYLSNHIIFREM